MTTVAQLRTACRSWLADPAHDPSGPVSPGADIRDRIALSLLRARIEAVALSCSVLMENADVVQVIHEAEAVKALFG